jgi:hypothetical protein
VIQQQQQQPQSEIGNTLKDVAQKFDRVALTISR